MAEKKTAAKVVTKKIEKVEKKTKKEIVGVEVKADPKMSKNESVKKAEKKNKTEKSDSKPKANKKDKLKNSEKKHSKKYRQAVELIEVDKIYPPQEAISLIKKTSTVKFDASVEVHVRLNIDPANSDQQVRGSLVLPAGTGRTKKVLAIVGTDKEKEAKDAGADYVGGEDMITKIEKGWLDFEVVVATPDMMSHLGKIGKILGTKGLMPNPKVGTVTNEIGKVTKNLKSGMIEYRADKNGIVHVIVGKVSFGEADLVKNYNELTDTLVKVKPNGVKGTYIKSIYVTTTMGPSVRIEQK